MRLAARGSVVECHRETPPAHIGDLPAARRDPYLFRSFQRGWRWFAHATKLWLLDAQAKAVYATGGDACVGSAPPLDALKETV